MLGRWELRPGVPFITGFELFAQSRAKRWDAPFLPKTSQGELSSFLIDANAFVRSNEQRSTVVIREWDLTAKTIFVGLILQRRTHFEETEGYEVREIPSASVIRVSGGAKTSDITPTESLKAHLAKHPHQADMTRPARLSGQSFHLYQWPLAEELPAATWLERVMEKHLSTAGHFWFFPFG